MFSHYTLKGVIAVSIASVFDQEKIQRLHRSKVVTVQEETPLSEVILTMKSEKSSVALILNSAQKLAGIFTERDVLMKVLGKNQDPSTPIRQMMTSSPHYLKVENSVASAVQLMVRHKVRNVPLLDAENHVESEVNILNIVAFFVEHFPEVYNLPPQPNQQLSSAEGA
jgi:CBS domain-containing protein